jgi:phosphatidylinositol alpha-1,6-mannosyltransferase
LLPQIAFPFRAPPIVSFVYHAELPNLSRMRRWSLRRSNVIVAISEFAACEAQRVLGTDCPIALCRLGLFPEYDQWVQSPPKTPPIMTGRRCILIVGRMVDGSRDKGHEALIRAMPSVAQAVPDALLVIVGRGADELRLRRLCQQLGVESHVHFAGYVPDQELPDYYRAADLFAMPSFGEGFGLVYLEAMYHSKPCVAGNLDAAREVVADGDTGILVTPGDVSQIQSALIRLLSDRELAWRMGAAGRRRYENHFTYGSFTARLRRALDGIRDVFQVREP